MSTLTQDCKEFAKEIMKMNGGSPSRMCYMVCAALDGWLGFVGENSRLVEGEVYGNHHYWIEIERGKQTLVIDPTASQFRSPFNQQLPDLYLKKRPSWYVPTHPPLKTAP